MPSIGKHKSLTIWKYIKNIESSKSFNHLLVIIINVIITKYEHRQSSILLIKTIRDILNYYV